MKGRMSQKFLERTPVLVLLSGILSSLIMFYVMQLWRADLHYVFASGSGDYILERMGIQNLIETGTRNLATRLGGFSGQQLYDYPVSDAFNYGIMKVMSLFTRDSAVIMNLFYLLTFPLAAMTSMLALSKIDISRTMSLFCSLLYPFMGYHFWRNENHLLLSAYYMVPLGILVVLWLMNGEQKMSFSRKKSFRKNVEENRKFLYSVLICLIISSTGVYYAFFMCFFLLFATIKTLFDERRWTKITTAGTVFLLTIAGGSAANFLPSFLYHLSGGERVASMPRAISDAETYGLKLIDLFIPTTGHHLGRFRNLVDLFHNSEPLANENTCVSLGILGSIGFIILLLYPLVAARSATLRQKLLRNLCLLAYAGILLATFGGFSSVVYRYIVHGIRAYNRICVFLFFFALAALAIFADAVIWGTKADTDSIRPVDALQRKPRYNGLVRFYKKHRRKLSIFLLPLLLLGLFDQVPVISVYPYESNKQTVQTVEAYFQQLEASVPEGTYVFALPYVAFPEPGVWYGSGPSSQLEGYLSTRTIHWSCAPIRGGREDAWLQSVAAMPAADMLAAVKAAGYHGIYINLLNYPDGTLAALKDELIVLSGSTPLVSSDGQKVFIAF